MELQLAILDINTLVESAVQSQLSAAEKTNIRVELRKYSQVLFVNADAERMMQVFANIISNAIKFSPPQGEVLVEVSVHDNQARVCVTDNGKGISEEYKETIFQKFHQADASTSRKFGGTGLGLIISKAIVEKHKGKIGFTSSPGKMTVFYIDLPIVSKPPK